MNRKWTLFVFLALACAAVLALRAKRPRAVDADWPVNVAHRGASVALPENTLGAFGTALEMGAGGLELDAHLTRDGHVVVIHDATVDRTTDGTGPVAGMTLEEVRGLDAAYRFDPNGDHAYPYRGRGIGVPTLAEVLEAFPGVTVNIDIKTKAPGAEKKVLEILRGAGAEGRTLVASSAHHAVLRRFRRVSGGRVATAASRFEVGVFLLLSALRLERLLRPGYTALQVPTTYGALRVVTPRFVAAAHSRGLRVDVWTIDEPEEMRALLALGVDAVMTERPEELAEVLRDETGP